VERTCEPVRGSLSGLAIHCGAVRWAPAPVGAPGRSAYGGRAIILSNVTRNHRPRQKEAASIYRSTLQPILISGEDHGESTPRQSDTDARFAGGNAEL